MTAMLAGQIAALVAFISLLACGAVLVTLGVRGRMRPIEPCCAHCGQRTGRGEFERSGTCPECGAHLQGRDDIRYFRRSPRLLLLAIGVFCSLLSLGGPLLVSAVMRGAAARTVTASTPTAELIGRIGEDPFLPTTALQELDGRAKSGRLSDPELRSIVDALLAHGRTHQDSWVPTEAGELLASAQDAGILTDADLRALGEAYVSLPTLALPERIREGWLLSPGVGGEELRGSLARQIALRDVRSNGQPVRMCSIASHTDDGPQPGATIDRIDASNRPFGMVQFELPPGTHQLESTFEITLMVKNLPRGPVTLVPSSTGAVHEVRGTSTIEVVARDAPPLVPLEILPQRQEEIRAGCLVKSLAVAPFRANRHDAAIFYALDASVPRVPGWAIAYQVELIAEEGDEDAPADAVIPLGSLWSLASENAASWSSGFLQGAVPLPESWREHWPKGVTIRLRPDPSIVERMPGAQRVWDDTIMIKDVPVFPVGAPPSSARRGEVSP